MTAGSHPIVAIDAQISPLTPGGVETNLVSLVGALGRARGPDRYFLLALRRHAQEVREVAGPNQQVLVWPFDQIRYVRKVKPQPPADGRWGFLRRAAGPGVPFVDLTFDVYRRLCQGPPRPARAESVDPLLAFHGVAAVHFPYPAFFETSLPFLYEPWDALHRHHPEFFPDGEREWRDRLYGEGCRRARFVVTATQWVKEDLVRQYGIPASKIAVVPRAPSLLAGDAAVAPPPEPLPDGFALYPAMTFPHKNHIALLRALAELRDRHGVVLPLVCTGRWYVPQRPVIREEVARLRLDGQVQFLGPVSPEILRGLYRAARFLVFPSLFEGQGFPLLEAMACGLPILAADATCIPEVVGDAALLFDGRRVDAIAEALLRAMRKPALLDRARARGFEQVRGWTWEAAARQFAAGYRVAAGAARSEGDDALWGRALSGRSDGR